MPRNKQESSVGIIELAKRAGVSPSTVSRALRVETRELVKPDVRERVLKLAEELNYVPHQGASQMRRSRQRLIHAILPGLDQIFYSEFHLDMLNCLVSLCRKEQIELRIAGWLPGERTLAEELRRISQNVGSVCFLGLPLQRADIESLAGFELPMTLFAGLYPQELKIEESQVPLVGVDNAEGARRLAEHIADRGYKRPALVRPRDPNREACERHDLLEAALQEQGFTSKQLQHFEGAFDYDSGWGLYEQVTGARRKPDLLVCLNDESALCMLDRMRHAGARCPEDLALVGFDDSRWAARTYPTLTSLRPDYSAMVKAMVDLLVLRYDRADETNPPTLQTFAPELVVRGSTGGE